VFIFNKRCRKFYYEYCAPIFSLVFIVKLRLVSTYDFSYHYTSVDSDPDLKQKYYYVPVYKHPDLW